MKVQLTFPGLVGAINEIDRELAAQANRAVNTTLTIRNWLIGLYIANYELKGSDRAEYGTRLLSALSEVLKDIGISNCNHRQLYRYKRFFIFYPEISGTLSPKSQGLIPDEVS